MYSLVSTLLLDAIQGLIMKLATASVMNEQLRKGQHDGSILIYRKILLTYIFVFLCIALGVMTINIHRKYNVC